MPSFAIKTTEDTRVVKWMHKVSKRLQKTDLIKSPFIGAIEYYDEGLYAVHIKPAYPRLIPNIGAFSLSIGSILLWYFGWFLLAKITIGLSIVIVLSWNMWWYPGIYQLVIMLQIRRLTGKFSKVKRADSEAIKRMAHGKI